MRPIGTRGLFKPRVASEVGRGLKAGRSVPDFGVIHWSTKETGWRERDFCPRSSIDLLRRRETPQHVFLHPLRDKLSRVHQS